MTPLTRLSDTWVNRPSLDYPLAAVAVALAVVVDPRNLLLTEQHGDWYQTLAGVNGALVGVATVAITLVLTVPPNDRLQRVLELVGPNLGRLVASCVGGLIVTTAGFASMFLLETAHHKARVAVTGALVAFALLRSFRLWRLFVSTVVVLTTPSTTTTSRRESPSAWERPLVAPDDYALPPRRVRRKAAK